MADSAWTEVHALTENPGPALGTLIPSIIPVAVQETGFSHFHVFDNPADWRVRDFGVQSVCFFPNGNKLYVIETYEELATLVKLKRK